jgi:hypothetical protein
VTDDSEHQGQTYEPEHDSTGQERPEAPASSPGVVPKHREPPVRGLGPRFAIVPDPPLVGNRLSVQPRESGEVNSALASHNGVLHGQPFPATPCSSKPAPIVTKEVP